MPGLTLRNFACLALTGLLFCACSPTARYRMAERLGMQDIPNDLPWKTHVICNNRCTSGSDAARIMATGFAGVYYQWQSTEFRECQRRCWKDHGYNAE